ncbi:MAG: helix-turn-helix domain-containing protein [Deltaproteobacteria bacterium]|nr:helix-turn-helix domain-containing protein [Deltaproteobacteria bacterium]
MSGTDVPNGLPARRASLTIHGELARARRTQLGLTQEDLAEQSGLTVRTVQSCEAGRRVSADTARRLHEALALPAHALALATPAETRQRLAACGCAPPPPPRRWASRPESERAIREAFAARDGARSVTLCGLSGIGKTSLARWAAAELQDDFDGGVVWLSLRGAELEAGPCTSLIVLARALAFEEALPSPEAVAPDQWLRAWRHHFWARTRLLVLDDAARVESVELLTEEAPHTNLLVTTNHRSVAERMRGTVLALGPLSDDSATDLLRSHLGAERLDADPAGARRLIRTLGGLPRSVQLAAEFLHRNRYVSAGSYAEGLEAFSPAATASWLRSLPADEETLLAAANQLAGRLSAGALKAYGDLSVLEGQTFSVGWAAAAIGAPDEVALATLSELADAYLIEDLGVDGPARQPAGAGSFRLDSQSQRAAVSVAAIQGSEARERLHRWAPERAAEIAALPWVEAMRAVGQDLGLWSLVCDGLVRGVHGDLGLSERLDRPEEAAGMRIGSLDDARSLARLLTAIGRMLVYLAPTGSRRWLVAGFAAAESEASVGTAGELGHLLGHARSVQLDFPSARVWYRAAVQRLREAGRWRAAGLAAVDMARMAYTTFDAGASLEELRLARDLLRRDGNSRAAEAATTVALAATGIHVPGYDDDWSSAAGLLQEAIDMVGTAEPTPFARAVAATAHVDLAVVRHLAGQGEAKAELASAFAHLVELMGDDPIDRFRLQGLARMLLDEPVPSLGDPVTLDAALLTCPQDLLGRRVIRLSELLVSMCEAAAGPPPDARAHILARGTAITDVIFGRPFMADDIGLALICPLGPVASAWDAKAQRACAAFIEHRLGGMPPLSQLLGQVAAFDA